MLRFGARFIPPLIVQITTTPFTVVEKETVVVTTTPLPLEPTTTPLIFVVTATPPPNSPTPQPTTTSAPPTNTQPPPTSAVALPFQDDFEQGLRPEWRVLSGQWATQNGRLQAVSDELTLEIGDSAWGSYTVDLDFYEYPNSVYLVVAQVFQYELSTYDSDWSAFQNNQWIAVANGRLVSRSGHLRFVVSGNTYSVYVDGKLHESLTYGSALQGPLGLNMRRNSGVIDNLVITTP